MGGKDPFLFRPTLCSKSTDNEGRRSFNNLAVREKGYSSASDADVFTYTSTNSNTAPLVNAK